MLKAYFEYLVSNCPSTPAPCSQALTLSFYHPTFKPSTLISSDSVVSYLFKLPVEKVEVCSIEVGQRVVGVHRYSLLVVLHSSGFVSHVLAYNAAVSEKLVVQWVVLHRRQKHNETNKLSAQH